MMKNDNFVEVPFEAISFKEDLDSLTTVRKSLPLIEWNRQIGSDVDSRYNDGANDDDSDVDNDDEEEFVSISV